MKRFFRTLVAAVLLSGAFSVSAQYYEVANQLTKLISPALSGSFNYKGYVEADGLAGIGDKRTNFIGISTSQGFRYSNWFFMGAGIGVDIAVTQSDPLDYAPQSDWSSNTYSTKVMLPVFTDFRFLIGGEKSVSAFIDLKLGASWLLGNGYLEINHAAMGHGAQFYLKPSVGMRIPVNSNNARQAFNIGLTYQLITSNNFYSYYNDNSLTLNNLGLTLGFEW